MSGILLPGQDDRPEPSGGIELPKGYAGSQQEKMVDETPIAEEAPERTEAEAEAPAAGEGPEMDLLFPPSGAQIQCPSCGTPFVVPVFTIVDLGVNPELKAPLLSGQLNVAQCSNCGAGGALGAPLMVHDPDNEFLGVFVPTEGGMDDIQRQKVIGELTQTLMRKLPTEQRRGYMLQPKQYMEWQRFIETLWESEGVTPEMLRRQRDQSESVQRLAALANDPTALKIAVERDGSLIDADYFALLDRLIMLTRSQGQPQGAEMLMQLRNQLLETTDAGAQVKEREEKVRAILTGITRETTREDLIEIVLGAWREEDGLQIVGALASAAAPLIDYQFLVLLAERLDATQDPEARAEIIELRDFLVQIQEQQQQSEASAAQQVQAILQEVLQADDSEAKLREYAELIDENFLGFLASNIRSAEQNNATAAAGRLRQVYEQALAIVQDNLPDDLKLLNQMLSASDPGSARKIMNENRDMLTPDFLASLTPLEEEMRSSGRTELADRIKSLRGQIALMI